MTDMPNPQAMMPTIAEVERRANDMIAAISNQRNAAQNEAVTLYTELQSAKREIEQLKAAVASAAGAGHPAEANGHDATATA